jgi:hypothetical protein
MEEMRNAYKILVRNLKGRDLPFERPRCRQEDNTKIITDKLDVSV